MNNKESHVEDDCTDSYNHKINTMSKEEHEKIAKLTNEIFDTLELAMKTGNPSSELAQKAAHLHRQWLSFYWPTYTKEAHEEVVKMYLEDERFKAYYDSKQAGTAQFLKDAVFIYTKNLSTL